MNGVIMQWQSISGWNLVITLLLMAGVLAIVRYTIYNDCTSLSRKLHTEAVAQVAMEHERTRNLERWLERTERIVMELRPRVARLESLSLDGAGRESRGEDREARGEQREIRSEERELKRDQQSAVKTDQPEQS